MTFSSCWQRLHWGYCFFGGAVQWDWHCDCEKPLLSPGKEHEALCVTPTQRPSQTMKMNQRIRSASWHYVSHVDDGVRPSQCSTSGILESSRSPWTFGPVDGSVSSAVKSKRRIVTRPVPRLGRPSPVLGVFGFGPWQQLERLHPRGAFIDADAQDEKRRRALHVTPSLYSHLLFTSHPTTDGQCFRPPLEFIFSKTQTHREA